MKSNKFIITLLMLVLIAAPAYSLIDDNPKAKKEKAKKEKVEKPAKEKKEKAPKAPKEVKAKEPKAKESKVKEPKTKAPKTKDSKSNASKAKGPKTRAVAIQAGTNPKDKTRPTLTDPEAAATAFGRLLYGIEHWSNKEVAPPNADTLAIALIKHFNYDPRMMVGIANAYDSIVNNATRESSRKYSKMSIEKYPGYAPGYAALAQNLTHFYGPDPKTNEIKLWVEKDSIPAAIELYESALKNAPNDSVSYLSYINFLCSPQAAIEDGLEHSVQLYDQMAANVKGYNVEIPKANLYYELQVKCQDEAVRQLVNNQDSVAYRALLDKAAGYDSLISQCYASVDVENMSAHDLIVYASKTNAEKRFELAQLGIEKHPGNPDFYRILVNAYTGRRQYKDAIEMAERLFSLSDTIQYIVPDYLNYANALQGDKQYKKAVQNYLKCLGTDIREGVNGNTDNQIKRTIYMQDDANIVLVMARNIAEMDGDIDLAADTYKSFLNGLEERYMNPWLASQLPALYTAEIELANGDEARQAELGRKARALYDELERNYSDYAYIWARYGFQLTTWYVDPDDERHEAVDYAIRCVNYQRQRETPDSQIMITCCRYLVNYYFTTVSDKANAKKYATLLYQLKPDAYKDASTWRMLGVNVKK